MPSALQQCSPGFRATLLQDVLHVWQSKVLQEYSFIKLEHQIHLQTFNKAFKRWQKITPSLRNLNWGKADVICWSLYTSFRGATCRSGGIRADVPMHAIVQTLLSQLCQNTNIPHWIQVPSQETVCQEWKVNTLKTQHSTPEEPRQYLTVPPVQLQAHSWWRWWQWGKETQKPWVAEWSFFVAHHEARRPKLRVVIKLNV